MYDRLRSTGKLSFLCVSRCFLIGCQFANFGAAAAHLAPALLTQANCWRVALAGSSFNWTVQSCQEDTFFFFSWLLLDMGGGGELFHWKNSVPEGVLGKKVDFSENVTSLLKKKFIYLLTAAIKTQNS